MPLLKPHTHLHHFCTCTYMHKCTHTHAQVYTHTHIHVLTQGTGP